MMNRSKSFIRNYFLSAVAILLVISCEPDRKSSNDELAAVKDWIFDVMDEVYYWNTSISNKSDHSAYGDPNDYFESLLHADDHWSWITDDYVALESEFNGNPTTMGYSPLFVRVNGTDFVVTVINYVYIDSPADKAGLKRGDIILTINNQKATITDYYDKYQMKSYSVQTAYVDNGTLYPTGESYDLVAAEISSDPIQHSDIIDKGTYRIGYLVYTDFINGENEVFQQKLSSVFENFKTAGITDLIVDLRDNRGGEIEAAGFLASSIAPAEVVSNNQVLINLKYNSLYQNHFQSTEGANTPKLVYRFPSVDNNLNLHNVYFLMSRYTASASELVISGLYPYMQVTTIGENTAGKYTGAWVIPDQNVPPNHNWAVVPIVSKYSNANGYTDFPDGLIPDYSIEEDVMNLLPFGDEQDVFLNKAIQLITGEGMQIEPKAAIQHNYTVMPVHEKPQHRSVIIPHLLPGLPVKW